MSLYELYGKLTEDKEKVDLAFAQTLGLLRRLKAGTVVLDQVTVNDDGWRIDPREE